jgi:DNA-binding transcriptional ArsR family regulator/rhodanese-related sulfurtransferase
VAGTRALKTAAYREIARMGKGLAHPTRLEILDLLCQRPWTVEALAEEIGQSVANTSHHLRLLRGAELLESHREGTYVTYRLAGPAVARLFTGLRELAERRRAEMDRIRDDFLEATGAFEGVDRETLIERIRSGEAVVLDVRPQEEFRHHHIPGAISMPLAEVESRLSELPRHRQIVAYCRGPYCVMAVEASAPAAWTSAPSSGG